MLPKLLIFSIFVALLIHSTAAWSDTFSFYHVTDVHAGDTEETPTPLVNLEAIVAIINEDVETDSSVRFVVLTGDVTNDATDAQFTDLKTTLDALTIPYFLTVGERDILRQDVDAGTYTVEGGLAIQTLFEPMWNHSWVTNTTIDRIVYNPMVNQPDVFVNYEFRIPGTKTVFLVLDWVSRQSDPFVTIFGSQTGPHRHAESHVTVPGGTWDWFVDRISSIVTEIQEDSASIERVVLLQHHPFEYAVYMDEENLGWGYAPNDDMLIELAEVLGLLPVVSGSFDLAGHLREFYDYVPFENTEFENVPSNPVAWKEYVTEDTQTGVRYAKVKFTSGQAGVDVEDFGADWLHRDLIIYAAAFGSVAFVALVVFGVFTGVIALICCIRRARANAKIIPVRHAK